jgi:CRISPR system Cascade subunit CasA
MNRYNLLDEPWIEVISKKQGKQTAVSLLELFHHAEQYRCLAGEMKTQDFAVLRLLLAVVQTVFSRFDSEGNPYPYFELNDHMQQVSEIDSDDEEDYADEREESWEKIWKSGHFPDIVCRYLEKWRDHFFLYSDQYPFYQVTAEEINAVKSGILNKNANFFGKNMNRLISESGNKTALFSPVIEDQKDILDSDELARWIIMLQGYIEVSDKVSIVEKEKGQKTSGGWLYDIGGLYLEGDNIFETLMVNYIPVHPENMYSASQQKPCWEQSGINNVNRLRKGKLIDNLAELYTNWSRAIYINPNHRDEDPISMHIVKLPAIEYQDNFLEPMTIWNKNTSGHYKGHYTPKKYSPDQAVWRSFGLIMLKTSMISEQHQPAIMERLNAVRKVIGSKWLNIQAVGMEEGNHTASRVIVDEIADMLRANDLVIADVSDNGWIVQINGAVEITKQIVGIYRRFIQDIAIIRGKDLKKGGEIFIISETEKLYQKLNEPFRMWLEGIHPTDSKEEQVSKWYGTLKMITTRQAEFMMNRATTRDFIGIEKEGRIYNIVEACQIFKSRILKKLG